MNMLGALYSLALVAMLKGHWVEAWRDHRHNSLSLMCFYYYYYYAAHDAWCSMLQVQPCVLRRLLLLPPSQRTRLLDDRDLEDAR